MHILRGIRMVVVRMMMVRLVTRATCHCEMCATCFPEGGVLTMTTENIRTKEIYNYHSFKISKHANTLHQSQISIILPYPLLSSNELPSTNQKVIHREGPLGFPRKIPSF